jgi:hypothetical protein
MGRSYTFPLEKTVNKQRLQLLSALLAIILATLACNFSASTANIKDAYLSTDTDGADQTTTFAPEDSTFYLTVILANAPSDTVTRAVWYAANVDTIEPNTKLDEASLTQGDGNLSFTLNNSQAWPAGDYKVEIYLNDKLDRTLDFNVQ